MKVPTRTHDDRMARRWRMPAVSALVVAIVVGIGWLQYTQWSRFQANVSQSRAGVEWDVFQLQSERFKMIAKLNEALLTRGDRAVMEDLLLRHEVLISRLDSMRVGSGAREAFRAPENRPINERLAAYAQAGDAYFGLGGEPPAFDEARVRSLRDALADMAASMQDLVLNINTIHIAQAQARSRQLREQAVVSGLTSLALAALVGVMGLMTLRQLIRVRRNNGELIAVRDQLEQALARAEVINEALTGSERQLQGLIDTAQDAIVSLDRSRCIVVFNSAAEAMFGRAARDVKGQPLSMLLPPVETAQQRELMARFEQAVDTERPNGPIAGLTAQRANGEVFPIEASLSTFDASGQITHLVILRDVTARERDFRALQDSEASLREAQGRVQQLAYFDGLTQIPNRVQYVDRVPALLRDAKARAGLGAALLIDLDNFKAINDNWGHRCGDKLLVEMAHRIVATVPAEAFVARLGGDEFIVMLSDLPSAAQGAAVQVGAVCRQLLAALSAPCSLDSREHVCSASIGVAMFGDAPLDADDLLSRADSAMYQAKAQGRNDFCFFDQQLQDRLAAMTELEADLRQSIARQELQLHVQPQVDTDGRWVGVEALVRWFHPVHGAVSPADFIPIAESSGLILQLGPWVLRSACRTLADWAANEGTAGLSMAVNVSARQFLHPDFVHQVTTALRLSGADPARLKLELTESVLAQDLSVIAQKMSALKALGVTFALDDFGTGYSSLAYLQRLPLDQIKIDRGFVRGLPGNANDAAIVRTVIALGQQLGFEVIAEGVETPEQLDFLRRQGCRLFQGHLFGHPEPARTLMMRAEAVPVTVT